MESHTQQNRISNPYPNPKDLSRTFRDFWGCHAGETILVCGCGSSLSQLASPQNYVTVGVNDVGRLFDPDYLVVVNTRQQFTGDRFRYVAESRARALFSHLDLGIDHPLTVRFQLGQRGGTDVSHPDALPYTSNSPYIALCLAAYMGASRIGLIGVDFTDHHFFAHTGRHTLSRRFAEIDREYTALYQKLTQQGIEVVNLSRESRLTGIPKRSLEAFTGSFSTEDPSTLLSLDRRSLPETPPRIVSYATIQSVTARRNLFDRKHQTNVSEKHESGCGPGSSLRQTVEIRQRLPQLLAEMEIRSVLDLPCGDFHWMQHVELGNIQYIGADILPHIIEINKRRFSTQRRRFVHRDLLTHALPGAELIFCRDCFVHFSYQEIHAALENIRASGLTYLMTTTYPDRATNTDIQTGDGRPLNFEKPPFNFPPPLHLLNEKCTESNEQYGDKSLGVWRISDIKV